MSEPDSPGERPGHGRFDTHWVWFGAILALLLTAGLLVAFLSLFPLAMATDGCHDGSTERICSLTARGQHVLVAIPWACLAVGAVTALVAAYLATRIRWTPLLGIPMGVIAAAAMIPLGDWIAYQV
ncbi:hypothetical protein [Mycobacterium sp. ENV421]|uniref:hypothetical protein n=1 Tax=Mycobacterium sp. ENV421 TaxID=1213407 RepID=UPI000C9CFAAE|nr:hypothetical protein [Mycobacterium sp. ENV421]